MSNLSFVAMSVSLIHSELAMGDLSLTARFHCIKTSQKQL